MRALPAFGLAMCLLVGSSSFARSSVGAIENRATSYNDIFFPRGVPGEVLDTLIPNKPAGTRQFLTVLPGVLYRGGGPGGQRPLPLKALRSLCEDGFSTAVYAYQLGFVDPGPVTCTNRLTGRPNTLRYVAGEATNPAFKAKFLAIVHDVAVNASKGPVFVHCWNGRHASGELAAIALRQMCDLNGAQASDYWLRHAGGFPLISRIGKFQPLSMLRVPFDVQGVLCR